MHVLDSIAAVLILLIFAVSNFGTSTQNDWTAYENKIAAQDLSYTIKKTGLLGDSLKGGETGNLKTAIDVISERDMDVSGEITGVPPNLDIGYYLLDSKRKSAPLTRVNTTNSCYGQVQNNLRPRSDQPILRTREGSLLESKNGGATLYLGNLRDGTNVGSLVDYDTIWIDSNEDCNFENLGNPVRENDIFQWGTGSMYEFRRVETQSNWRGTLYVAEAGQMNRLQNSLNQRIGGINNRVRIDSFRLQEDLESYDMLLIPGSNSVQEIQSSPRTDTMKQQSQEKPVVFMADATKTLVQDTFIGEVGFQWEDLRYSATADANCPLTGPHTIDDCGHIRMGYTENPRSKGLESRIKAHRTRTSSVTLRPEGSITSRDKGILSTQKILELPEYRYNKIGRDRVRKDLSQTSLADSKEPATYCNNVTTADYSFPDREGVLDSITVVNTQLGGTDSYCQQNNRAVYIDKDSDGDYAQESEGPYQDGETIEIRGLTYTVDIMPSYTPGCGPDDCVGFINQENAKVSLFNYNSEQGVARIPYEEQYSQSDRKVIAAFLYTISDPMDIPSSVQGDISTNIYGTVEGNSYEVNMRWNQ